MLITKIRCYGCGHEGEVEIVGLAPRVKPDRLFLYLGCDEFTGNMYLRCPRCGMEVLANPMELLGPGHINGIPVYRPAVPAQSGGSGIAPGAF